MYDRLDVRPEPSLNRYFFIVSDDNHTVLL